MIALNQVVVEHTYNGFQSDYFTRIGNTPQFSLFTRLHPDIDY